MIRIRKRRKYILLHIGGIVVRSQKAVNGQSLSPCGHSFSPRPVDELKKY